MAIAAQPTNLHNQTIGGRKVTMVDLGNGFLGFQVPGLGVVPAGIASVAAGKDRWMRSIKVQCSCGAVVPVEQTDDNQSCEDCQWASPDECRE